MTIALLSVIANYGFISLYGITGAVISQIVVAVVYVVMTDTVSQKLYSVRYDYKTLVAVLLIVITLFGVSLMAEQMSVILRLVVKSLIVIAFVPIVVWGVLKEDEKMAIANWISAFSGKRN